MHCRRAKFTSCLSKVRVVFSWWSQANCIKLIDKVKACKIPSYLRMFPQAATGKLFNIPPDKIILWMTMKNGFYTCPTTVVQYTSAPTNTVRVHYKPSNKLKENIAWCVHSVNRLIIIVWRLHSRYYCRVFWLVRQIQILVSVACAGFWKGRLLAVTSCFVFNNGSPESHSWLQHTCWLKDNNWKATYSNMHTLIRLFHIADLTYIFL